MRHNEEFRMTSEPSASPSTPFMRQYHGLKQQVPNTLLMFRLGDFYELFYEDAVTAARELEITLTARNKEKGQPIPMCGVPYHSAENYIARLTQKGYRVAICEQMEDPRLAKKLVKRELTRVVTPGTATDSALLRSRENNYLTALATGGNRAGLAHVDVSTGEFRVTELETAEAPAAVGAVGRQGDAWWRKARRLRRVSPRCAPRWMPGPSAPTTPNALCASTSVC